jgi:hypothetical protein
MFDPNVLIAIATVVVIIALVATLAGGILLGKILSEQKEQREKITRLEDLQPKRLTHNTAAGLEDEIAILRDVRDHLEAYRTRIDQALGVARTLRADPKAYDPNGRAGKRVDDLVESVKRDQS